MMKKILHTPEGVRDIYNAEYEKKVILEQGDLLFLNQNAGLFDKNCKIQQKSLAILMSVRYNVSMFVLSEFFQRRYFFNNGQIEVKE